ncbi:Ig-like domain-containing protein [Streptomyces sp. NPDC050610]|uniref:L,D-transpeptidase n=1 Tax=Streptomyces sp. NPDC050610 TaxID=3157097 RepID=UPI003428AAE6
MEKRVMTYGKRRKGLVAAAAVLGGVLALAACGGGDDKGGDSGHGKSQSKVDEAAAKDASKAKIKIASKNGSSSASINTGGKVTVSEGKLTKVTMTTEKGAPVEGAISSDGTSWAPKKALERQTTYKIAAEAKDSDGRNATENSSFTTVAPSNSFIGTYTPDAGSTVGVGMPVSINFDKPIKDKKAVQSHITVNSTSGQKVVGHWFGNQRLDFRPQEYWKAGSTVTMKMDLDKVESAPGVQGVQQKTVSFKIGRSQVSTVDARSHQMTVVRDGKTIKTIPISAGSPDHTTYNGQMVISEKFKETRMNGDTVGFGGEYDIKDVPHAMRLSNSGTFIHGNYWGHGIFGTANTSHGCVGLQDAQGGNDSSTSGSWFFSNSIVGDVVTVKGSDDKLVQPDNGLNGWNMSWDNWVAGSATGA